MDTEQFLKDFQDRLAPRLDTYEQAIYLYVFRHSRLIGQDDVVIGFKSARRRVACGIGEKGKPMSERTAYEKLRSLQEKGCIAILDSNRDGTKIRLNLPAEISGLVLDAATEIPKLEDEDFFEIETNRLRILEREKRKCFYCVRQLTADNYVIEHVISRPIGPNSYLNVVAACRQCNNRKGSSEAIAWLRTLYREGLLDADSFQERTANLEQLRAGHLRPPDAEK